MPNGFFSVCVNVIYNCMVITIIHLFTVEKKTHTNPEPFVAIYNATNLLQPGVAFLYPVNTSENL